MQRLRKGKRLVKPHKPAAPDPVEMSIRAQGNLSDVVRKSGPAFRAAHPTGFALVADINPVLQRMIFLAIEMHGDNPIYSAETFSTRILIRCVSFWQSAMLLTELGLTLEAETLLRSVTEGTVLLQGLDAIPEKTLNHIRDDSVRSEIQRTRLFAAAIAEDDPVKMAEFEERIAKFQALERDKKRDLHEIAKDSDALSSYFLFRQLSADAAHVSLNSLETHVFRNEAGDAKGYNIGPMVDGVERALNLGAQTVLAMSAAFAFMWKLEGLQAELGDLQARSLAEAKTISRTPPIG